MTMDHLTLAFDVVVAVLLGATIYFAVRLDRRISALRADEAGLGQTIASFAEASARAEASAAALKQAGLDAETSLRGAVEKAQALRDDLVFMIDRGGAVADRVERMTVGVRPAAERKAEAPAPARPANEPGAPRSETERDILKALRAARVES